MSQSQPEICYDCRTRFNSSLPDCLDCKTRYAFDLALPGHIRFGPIAVPDSTGKIEVVGCVTRRRTEHYVQLIRWTTGEVLPPLALDSYPSSSPVVDRGGRIVLVLGGSHKVVVIDPHSDPVQMTEKRTPGKPLSCFINQHNQVVTVCASRNGCTAYVWEIGSGVDFQPIAQLTEFAIGDQELIQVGYDLAVFRSSKRSGTPSWHLFNASDLVTYPLSVPAADDSGPVPCGGDTGQTAVLHSAGIVLAGRDGSQRTFDQPVHTGKVTTLSLYRNGDQLVGTYDLATLESSFRAYLHFRHFGQDAWRTFRLPTRPHRIVRLLQPQGRTRAIILTHSGERGSYLLDIDLDEQNTYIMNTLVHAPACSADTLVVHWPAVAIGSGNILYKRPLYADRDAQIVRAERPRPSPGTTWTISATTVTQPAPSGHRSVTPQPVSQTPSVIPEAVEIVPSCRVDASVVELDSTHPLYFELATKDARCRFRILSFTPPPAVNRNILTHYWGNADIASREFRTEHTASVEIQFRTFGKTTIKFEFLCVDEYGRCQRISVQQEYEVINTNRSGNYHIAQGDQIVINRTAH